MPLDRIARFRLRGQHLDRRVARSELISMVGDVGGLHAQLMSSAELEAWVRVKSVRPEDVRRALWEDRTLAKTWLMRGTLHLVPGGDLSMYVAAVGTRRMQSGYLQKHIGVTERELAPIIDAIADVLDGRCLTRHELAAEVEARVGGDASKRPEPAWMWFLRMAASTGALCYAPNRGRSATFTNPRTWLGSWQTWQEEDARAELLRRYLHAHGPASREDYAWWLNMTPVGQVKAAWASVEQELKEVESGRFILASDAGRLGARVAVERVRFLPAFDAALLGHKGRRHLVEEKHFARIWRKAAWVTPAVLIDGRVAGVWSHEIKRGRVAVEVEAFKRLDRETKSLCEAEARSLGDFLGAEPEVAFA